jgi:hypothetical protein
VLVDDHPFAVADAVGGEAGDADRGARQVDPAAALDRIDVQRRDAQVAQLRSPAM